QQQQPAAAGQGAGWGQTSQSVQWGDQPPPPQPAKSERGNWSIEAEQMETGTWRAFAPDLGLGAPPGAPPAAPAGKAFDPMDELSPDRWDVPIQERAAQAQAAQAAPAGGAGDINRFDQPIQER